MLGKNELKFDHGFKCKKQPLKFLRENIGENLQDLLDIISKAGVIQEKISKLDFIKLKTLALQKPLLKDKPQPWRKYCKPHI